MHAYSPDEWGRIEPILDEALELDVYSRAAFLEKACGDDLKLREEVAALILAATETEGFLDTAEPGNAFSLISAGMSAPEPEPSVGRRIGPYRIAREIGYGGMGRVYRAERADGLWERDVALKVVRRDLPSREILDRFVYERRILARLDHPNIARLLDGGATEDGQPYFAMELVEGSPINRFCDENRLTVDQRLDLFLRVCDAVQYAHQNLVIHRDLKPTNIQVTQESEVKLLDFGISKLLDAGIEGDEVAGPVTRVGGIQAMTPEYAAPEQLLGQRVTTATDVYSLGVILYELLTGHRPYRFARRTPAEIERVVCGQDPIRPSAMVRETETILHGDGSKEIVSPEEIGRARSIHPERLRRRLRGDLDQVVLRALQKEPDRRYGTVAALARDIRRFRTGRPVQARSEGPVYRLVKFVHRNKAVVTAAIVYLAVLLGGISSTVWQASLARQEAERAMDVKNLMLGLFDLFDPEVSSIDSITGRVLLEVGIERTEQGLTGQPDTQSELLAEFGSIYGRLGDYERAIPLLERAVELRRQGHAEPDAPLASAMTELALVLTQEGEYQRAESLHRAALAMRTELFGAGSSESTRSMAGLARVLSGLGSHDEAIELFEEVLRRDTDQFGQVHEMIAADLGDLAQALHRAGRPREAEPYQRRALEMRENVSGPDHLATAMAMNQLGAVRDQLGDLDGADTLYRKVLDFDRRRLGDSHEHTVAVKNNLATLLWRKGELAEAEQLFREVVDWDLEHQGRRHRHTPIVLLSLAGTLRDRGKLVEAERYARDATDILRELYGDLHRDVGSALAVLGSIERQRGAHAAAEQWYDRALQILDASAGDHLETATALVGLGELLTDQGRGSEAIPFLRRAVRIRKAALENDPEAAEASTALGRALLTEGRIEEADEHLASAHTALSDLPYAGTIHARTLELMAELAARQGRSELEAEYREQARQRAGRTSAGW